MSASLLVLLPILALGVLAVVVTAVVLLVTADRTPDPSRAAAGARRHAAVVSALAWVALLLGLLVGPSLAAAVDGVQQGVALGLVPGLAGVLFVAVHLVGELTWPRPTGTVRRADLARRGVGDVAPRHLRRVLWAWAATVAVVGVAGGVAATGGRQVSRVVDDGAMSAGPFPGWFYGLPLLVACVVVLAATEGVLRVVASRSAVVDAQPRWDVALRRLSAHRVLRGAQLVVGLTAAGMLLFAGTALRSVGTAVVGDSGTSLGHMAAGTAAVVLAVVVGLTAVVVAALPAVPAGQLATPAEPRTAPLPP
ncbi:hypothetical protein [Actinotalea sp. Marseille-Q4924]|uniref:hypothetical protein n=1 Tax=Actinotalea sp. Marseille-Q4924 TaxID=2866571 RepID=UPI001CE3D1E1|nr:hypothetical protein [Actinotalea sp. Marseille-Q4924]